LVAFKAGSRRGTGLFCCRRGFRLDCQNGVAAEYDQMYVVKMKTHPAFNSSPVQMIFCLSVAAACLTAGLAYADEVKSCPTASKLGEKKDAKEAKVTVVGSNIPKDANRMGAIPTTASPVVVIDRNEIERSGRVTAAGVLSRQPAFR
jgi:hypothetical protein